MTDIEISFNKITIFEWYDGIVRGIGKTKDSFYLIALNEWDCSRHRAYLFLDLNEVTAAGFQTIPDNPDNKATIEANWKQLNSIWDDYVRDYQGNIYLSAVEPGENVKLDLKITNDADYLNRLINYDVEKTIVNK